MLKKLSIYLVALLLILELTFKTPLLTPKAEAATDTPLSVPASIFSGIIHFFSSLFTSSQPATVIVTVPPKKIIALNTPSTTPSALPPPPTPADTKKISSSLTISGTPSIVNHYITTTTSGGITQADLSAGLLGLKTTLETEIKNMPQQQPVSYGGSFGGPSTADIQNLQTQITTISAGGGSSSFSTTATGLTYSGGVLSLTSGYNIPLTASTTAWDNFTTTPSSVIIAGTGLSWSGNTLNAIAPDLNSLSPVALGSGNSIGSFSSYSACYSNYNYSGTESGSYTIAIPGNEASTINSGFGSICVTDSNNSCSFNISSGSAYYSSGSTYVTYSGYYIPTGDSVSLSFCTCSCNCTGSSCYPGASAVGVSNTVCGCRASAFGYSNTASGYASSAFGYYNTASGCYSSAFGYNNFATGTYSSAFGSCLNNSTACSVEIGANNTNKLRINNSGVNFITSGGGGFCVNGTLVGGGGGLTNTASGYHTLAVGYCNTASGLYGFSSAFGSFNSASGSYSTASGYRNNAGGYSIAEGYRNTASGYCSSAFGFENTASAYFSSALGVCNAAYGTGSSAFGFNNTASSNRSSAFGFENTASGYGSSAFGYGNTASGLYASAFGTCLNNSTDRSTEIGYGGGYIRVNANGSITASNGASLTAGGTWTNASDRNLKENFTDLDSATILADINNLPITEWNYKTEGSSVKHIGPVAQDFYSIFNVGNASTSISTIDPAGIALIGIQELSKEVTALQQAIGTSTINDRVLTNNTLTVSTSSPQADESLLASTFNDFISGIKNWATGEISAVTGYFKNIFASKVTTTEITSTKDTTQTLCIGNVCLTQDQLKAVLEYAHVSTTTQLASPTISSDSTGSNTSPQGSSSQADVTSSTTPDISNSTTTPQINSNSSSEATSTPDTTSSTTPDVVISAPEVSSTPVVVTPAPDQSSDASTTNQ